MSTTLTVLRSIDPRKLLTKRLYRNSDGSIAKQGYGNAYKFQCTRLQVADIFELGAALTDLRKDACSCVIRGEPLPSVDVTQPVLRRKLAKGADAVYFRSKEAGERWILLDFDKIPTPAEIDPARDPEAAIKYVISLLPAEFHSSTCWYQWSSSAGLDGWRTLRLHLWYMLDRPIPDGELRHWARRSGAPVDPALFDAVQVHYVADPVLEDCVVDPVPMRSGFIEAPETVVCLRLPEKAEYRIASKLGTETSSRSSPGFDGWINRIGDHPGGQGFHEPIRGAIACYVAINGAEGTDLEELKAIIRRTIQNANRSQHSEDIERYSSNAYLDDLIRGAIQKFARRTRLIPGVKPHYNSPELSPEAAQTEIRDTLAAFTAPLKLF